MAITQQQIELEKKLEELIQDRKEKISELKKFKKAFVNDDSKKNKWLIEMTAHIEKLDIYITQHINRIEGMKQRSKHVDQTVDRKRDTKRKIIMGAYFEYLLKTGELDPSYKEKFLNFLKRDSDKSLFRNF
jgi:predicted RNase H-like nuclease (RuvC/YqgF family)